MLEEIYFISRGNAILYDRKGVIPFLQLPCYSFIGEYQLIFNLRANYVVKVGGDKKGENERTFFLCVTKEKFLNLLNQYPKSKSVIQKRSLERRKVIIGHLELTEAFIARKNEKHQKISRKRTLYNAQIKAFATVMGGELTNKFSNNSTKHLQEVINEVSLSLSSKSNIHD